MAGISIQGIKLRRLSLENDKETGAYKVTGSYELVSNTGIVLAKQSFNGYDEIKVEGGAETKQAINNLVERFTLELNATLGLG